jgi:hypothetical protein
MTNNTLNIFNLHEPYFYKKSRAKNEQIASKQRKGGTLFMHHTSTYLDLSTLKFEVDISSTFWFMSQASSWLQFTQTNFVGGITRDLYMFKAILYENLSFYFFWIPVMVSL